MSTQFRVGEYVVCVEGKVYGDARGLIVEEGKVYRIHDQYMDGMRDQFVRVVRLDGSISPNLYAKRFQRREGYSPVSRVIEKIRQLEARQPYYKGIQSAL